MRNPTRTGLPNGERGAVQIKTALSVVVLLLGAFIIIKVAPVYIEQRQIAHEVEELARIAAVRRMEKDKINKQIGEIQNKYSLRDGSISLAEDPKNGRVNITVNYNVKIDFLLTEYDWQYNDTIQGKEF